MSSTLLSVGETIDRYELLDVLGVGAFATVWRAHDPVIDEYVAIKVLADNWARDAEMRRRFLREAKLALQVTNEHLIRVHIVAEAADTGIPYIVMALADAGTLRERINERRLNPHSVDEALATIRDVAIATAALHDNGLLHRDLKPANILFQETRTGGERLVLGDFGLARAIERSALTMVAGTPAYAAPEQAAGVTQLTPQADLYPLGVMFLELVTGELPTNNASMVDTATTTIDIDQVLSTPTPIAVDADTRRLVESLIAKEPGGRPASAHDVANTITTILGDQQRVLSPAPTPRPTAAATQQSPTVQVDRPEAQRVSDAKALTPEPAERLPASANKLGLAAAVGAGVVGLVIIGFLLLNNPDNSSTVTQDATTTTTEATAATDSTTTTAAAVSASAQPDESVAPDVDTVDVSAPAAVTTDIDPDAELADDFPKPTGAILETALSSGNRVQAFTVASTPAQVVQFYSTSDWMITGRSDEDPAIVLQLENEERIALARIEPINNSSGVNLVRLIITAVA